MHEARRLLQAARSLDPRETALATVVELTGSGYRRPGARLLAGRDGQTWGGISGGCLEADALEQARGAIADNRARLVTYDTTHPDDALLGVGLGCEGVLRVLIEPLASPGCTAFLAAWEGLLVSQAALLQAQVVSVSGRVAARPGDRVVWQNGDVHHADLRKGPLLSRLRAAAPGAITTRAGLERLVLPTGEVTIFWEAPKPPAVLWLCGAGLDAPVMAEMASLQGYDVYVLDHRPAFALRERFATAHDVVCTRPGKVPAHLPHPTAAILMTHQFESDRAWLPALLELPLAYLGLLGPRRRAERLLDELRAAGKLVDSAWPAHLHAPLGLDIGAETPAEVALSALAELKAVLSARAGASLRKRRAPIHEEGAAWQSGILA